MPSEGWFPHVLRPDKKKKQKTQYLKENSHAKMEKGESSIPVTNLDDEHTNSKTECEEFQFSSPNGLILGDNSTSNINNGNVYKI